MFDILSLMLVNCLLVNMKDMTMFRLMPLLMNLAAFPAAYQPLLEIVAPFTHVRGVGVPCYALVLGLLLGELTDHMDMQQYSVDLIVITLPGS